MILVLEAELSNLFRFKRKKFVITHKLSYLHIKQEDNEPQNEIL